MDNRTCLLVGKYISNVHMCCIHQGLPLVDCCDALDLRLHYQKMDEIRPHSSGKMISPLPSRSGSYLAISDNRLLSAAVTSY